MTVPPRIFDRPAYRARRMRAAPGERDRILVEDTASQAASRIAAINRRFTQGLDLDSRTQAFAAIQPLADTWVRTGDLPDRPPVVADDEWLPFAEESFDLVTSILALHAVNDLPGTLVQIRRVLKPDGLFIAAMFGGETLKELRVAFAAAEDAILGGASPRVAPFADVRDVGSLLQRAGFALPVTDVERTVIRYRDVTRLFADLRAIGETNVLANRRVETLSKRTLAAVIREYRARFGTADGRFPATFEIVFLTGWAPHESQQKPLRPGSAKTRLSDALGTVERSAGESVPLRKPKT
jgi:ubiquinone/menaquinone biosynthesis C-methylase UbiE